MRERMAQELTLLRSKYGSDVDYREAGDWFLVPKYPTPSPCTPSPISVCFNLRPGYPGADPYGFFASDDVRFDGRTFDQTSAAAPPPFAEQWIFFSWAPEGWLGTADVTTGSNLWAWSRSFAMRLREGP